MKTRQKERRKLKYNNLMKILTSVDDQSARIDGIFSRRSVLSSRQQSSSSSSSSSFHDAIEVDALEAKVRRDAVSQLAVDFEFDIAGRQVSVKRISVKPFKEGDGEKATPTKQLEQPHVHAEQKKLTRQL